MPITNQPLTPPRPLVLVVGHIDDEELRIAHDAFARRGYSLQATEKGKLVEQADSADSVVLLPSLVRRGEQAATMVQYGPRLLDADCRIHLRTAKSSDSDMLLNALTEANLPVGYNSDPAFSAIAQEQYWPRVQICAHGTSWEELSQRVADYPAGPRPSGDLDIVGGTLSFSQEMLVRRAFYDCSRVELEKMEGMSGVTAYRVYASVRGNMLGPSPYPFFIKVGDRGKIVSEVEKYRGNALAYIPFHLGPRLIERRCGLGAESGLLVCDLISDCLCLKDCAKFAGVSAIASLFNRTLKAWHETSKIREGSLAAFLAPRLDKRPEIPEARYAIAQELGARRDFNTLRQLLARRDRIESVRIGAIHGDLHATNVMVRGFDAVLIDFESQTNDQPLLIDPASLEAGLLVDGFCNEGRTAADILDSLRALYIGDLLGWRATPHAATQSAWFYDCVRQIRLHAKHLECAPGQYATALACALLSKAANADETLAQDEDRHRMRAVGYVLAEQILTSIS